MFYTVRAQRPLIPFLKDFLVIPSIGLVAILGCTVTSCFLAWDALYASGPYWMTKLFMFAMILAYYVEHCRAEYLKRWTDDLRGQLEECNAHILSQNESLRKQNDILEKALSTYESQQ